MILFGVKFTFKKLHLGSLLYSELGKKSYLEYGTI